MTKKSDFEKAIIAKQKAFKKNAEKEAKAHDDAFHKTLKDREDAANPDNSRRSNEKKADKKTKSD